MLLLSRKVKPVDDRGLLHVTAYARASLDSQMRVALEHSASAPRTQDRLSVPEVRQRYIDERRFWNEDAPSVANVVSRTIDGPYGKIPLRLHYPTERLVHDVLIYMHGGGWVVGNLDTHSKIMRLLALKSDAVVVGVDYRLSPEHKFPVAFDETLAVAHWLAECGADNGLRPTGIALGGDSAGANLATAAAVSLRSSHPELVRALLLYYGVFGLDDSVSHRLNGGGEFGLSRTDMAFYLDAYLRSPADKRDPRFNVLDADLSGLPSTFVAAAQLDPLYDDSVALHARLERADVPVKMIRYDGVVHGFLHMSRMVDKSMLAISQGAQFLRDALK